MGDSVEYGKVVEGMRDVFKTGRTKSIQWRTSQLQAAIRCLTEQREKLCQALLKDLRKVSTRAQSALIYSPTG